MDDRQDRNAETGRDPLEALARLPAHDLDAWRTERLRREARAQFVRAHRLSRQRWFVLLRRTYRLALEPAFVAIVSAAYLSWAFKTVIGLFP